MSLVQSSPAQMAGAIHLRPASLADLEACGRIMYAAFDGIAAAHGFLADFPNVEVTTGLAATLLADPSVYAVIAERDGVVLGSNFLSEGDPIRGVGPISVDPAVQGNGIGRLLMEAVLRRGEGAEGIRLCQDAFNTRSLALYASLGFEVKEPLLLLHGAPAGAADSVRPMLPGDVEGADLLCERAHGISRRHEIGSAVARHRPVVVSREGRITGYLTAPHLWPLNHGVGETEADMAALLTGAAALSGEPVSLLVPSRQSSLLRHCLASGMRVVKPMTLMAIGPYREPAGCWFPSVFY